VPPDLPVGLALSGGIDSSSLAGALAHTSLRGTRQIRAFSVQPPHTASESGLIDATTRHTGLPHTYASLDGLNHAASLARLIEFHDEPIHSSGFLYQFLLYETVARAGCKGVLVGYGSDEIFAGYPHFAEPFLVALAADGRGREAGRFLWGAVQSHLGRMVVASVVRRARESLVRRSARFSDWDLQRSGSDVLAPDYGREEWPRPREAGGLDRDGLTGGRIFFDALLDDFRANIPLLVRVEDRNAAAHGLELCLPFMDEDLVLLAWSFPFHRYMAEGRNKAILRDAASGLLAPEVLSHRQKVGTPGNDAHLVFEVLRPAFSELLNSKSFYSHGVWSPRCAQLYRADAERGTRAGLWFRVYMVHHWYQRVVRSADGSV
jgi:asparagine synthase (glutamine-hydrolysing)